jgi:uncharacterized protein (DUF488 family)
VSKRSGARSEPEANAARRAVYTIGHSSHAFSTFLELLAGARIDEVIDVRSMPYSRRHPQFTRESLVARLREHGIAYVFLGRELGARSPDPDVWEDGRVSFARLARTPAFLAGLERVRADSLERRVALLCAEREPLDCHRTLLICRALRAPDVELWHILATGELESHADTEQRLLAGDRGAQRDLFGDDAAALERAYDRLGARIAYRGPRPDAAKGPHPQG